MNAEPSRETTFIVMLLLLLKCTEHKGLKMNKCVNMPSNGGRNFFLFFFLFLFFFFPPLGEGMLHGKLGWVR